VTTSAVAPSRVGPWRRRRIGAGQSWKLSVSLAVGTALVLAIAAPGLFTPRDPLAQALAERLRPPAWSRGGAAAHPLGTDALGRDVLARVVYGARLSVPVAVSAVAAAGIAGTSLGVVAGYFGGAVDLIVIALADFMLSFPFMLTALLVAAVLGPGVFNLIVVLAISTWPTYARIARAEAASVRRREFMMAARALGLRTGTMLRRHLLPNISSSLIVIASVEVARLMIAEAFLSFLGLGVPSPLPSWGGMIADGRVYLLQQPWLATAPGLAILTSATAFNLLGDVLRDALDPGLRIRGLD
jgi:peptide/nickel transport system permease protein